MRVGFVDIRLRRRTCAGVMAVTRGGRLARKSHFGNFAPTSVHISEPFVNHFGSISELSEGGILKNQSLAIPYPPSPLNYEPFSVYIGRGKEDADSTASCANIFRPSNAGGQGAERPKKSKFVFLLLGAPAWGRLAPGVDSPRPMPYNRRTQPDN